MSDQEARSAAHTPSGEFLILLEAETVDVSLILSAHVAENANVFPKVLALHVPKGSVVADVTYGQGVFWRDVVLDDYELLASDLATGTDCTDLPYEDSSVDAVVLDPPYIAGFFRPRVAGEGYANFTHRYSQVEDDDARQATYHEGVLDLYRRAGAEAHRVLRPGGRLIVKCQDEVHAGRQYMTHIEIVQMYEGIFAIRDLFVVVRVCGNFQARGRAKRNGAQRHARKNHSYFLVFVAHKPGTATVRRPK